MHLGGKLHGTVAALCALLLALSSGCSAAPDAPASVMVPERGVFQVVGEIDGRGLPEISGIAASRRAPDRWWAANDSGNPATLFALDASGRLLAEVPVAGARNLDWEDLASFVDERGRPWLLIGDIGDNRARRKDARLLLVPEPDLADAEAKVAATVRFRYADGPRDAEGLAVDLRRRQVLITDKRHHPVGVYALSLDEVLAATAAAGPLVAQRVAELPALAQEPLARLDPVNLLRLGMATALDLSADGRKLLVLTYLNAVVYERREAESWADVAIRPPSFIPLPRRPMFESAAWSPDGGSIWVTVEGGGKPAPLYRWRDPGPE